jgi:hypothetical protein
MSDNALMGVVLALLFIGIVVYLRRTGRREND